MCWSCSTWPAPPTSSKTLKFAKTRERNVGEATRRYSGLFKKWFSEALRKKVAFGRKHLDMSQILQSTFKGSELWDLFNQIPFNYHIYGDQKLDFSNSLLQIGMARIPETQGLIFVSVQPCSTTPFRVPFPLPTPQGRRDSHLRTMPEREIRILRKATLRAWRPLRQTY